MCVHYAGMYTCTYIRMYVHVYTYVHVRTYAFAFVLHTYKHVHKLKQYVLTKDDSDLQVQGE